jgi:hypothetical protein
MRMIDPTLPRYGTDLIATAKRVTTHSREWVGFPSIHTVLGMNETIRKHKWKMIRDRG